MQELLDAIITAVKLFPIVAAIITLPYILIQYSRYSSVMVLRIVIIYSFILYVMCAALLTILPIPDTIFTAKQTIPQFVPFYSIRHWLTTANFDLLDISTWKNTFFSRPAFFIIANVMMMIPMGIYLRYYFECNFGKTLVITLGFSLILELIQLTGLFGIYKTAYRYFDVDDIILNTFGGIIGFWLAKLPMKLLPSQQQLNSIAYQKGLRVSPVRNIAAVLMDWLLIFGIIALVWYFCIPLRQYVLDLSRKWKVVAAGLTYFGAVALYFICGEWLLRGRTVGKWITHLRSVDSRDGKRPKLWQCFVKYAFVYYGYASVPLIAILLLMNIIKKYVTNSNLLNYGFGLMAIYALVIIVLIISVLVRQKQLPHSAWSKLHLVSTFQSQKPNNESNVLDVEELHNNEPL